MVRLSRVNNIKLNFGAPQNIEEWKRGSFKEDFALHFLEGKKHIETNELKDVACFHLTFGDDRLAINGCVQPRAGMKSCHVWSSFVTVELVPGGRAGGWVGPPPYPSILLPFLSHPLKLQNELPLAAAQSLSQRKDKT